MQRQYQQRAGGYGVFLDVTAAGAPFSREENWWDGNRHSCPLPDIFLCFSLLLFRQRGTFGVAASEREGSEAHLLACLKNHLYFF